jgi:hypothetical protein
MPEDSILFAPTTVKRQIRARGPVDSAALNDMLDGIHADIVQLGDLINRVFLGNKSDMTNMTMELHTLRQRMAELEAIKETGDIFRSDASESVHFITDFEDISNIDTSAFNTARRLRVDPLYGQVTVPFNQYRSAFHVVDPRTEDIFVPREVLPTVTTISESTGVATEGTPRNAFNGQNESFWVRTVSFPLSDDIDEVECQMDVDVPLDFVQLSNSFTIHPHPLGLTDITEILYSTDTSDPTTLLPGFPTAGVKNTKRLRYYFAPIGITKLRIKFKQREWVEREGLKVFTYGAQEVDLALIEFDKTDDPAMLNNNAMTLSLDAPAGFTFNQITNLLTDPVVDVAGAPTGLFIELYAEASLSTKLWASNVDPSPSSTPIALGALSLSTIYFLVVLKYLPASQNTPVLQRFGIEYSTTT